MAKITIFERDVTSPGSENITNNIAYVPGYAIMGPVNTPTYFETLEKFQKVFGTKPYVFKTLQTYNNFSANAQVGDYAQAEEQEKSYIYATELLKNGLPVLFERVMKKETINTFTASNTGTTNAAIINIKAKNPGNYGNEIKYKITSVTNTSILLDLSLSVDPVLGIPKSIIKQYTISSDPTNNKYIDKQIYELVDITFVDITEHPLSEIADDIDFVNLSNGQAAVDEFTVANMYDIMNGYTNAGTNYESIFNKLEDKGEYNIKFITTGSYPVFENIFTVGNDTIENGITKNILKIASKRGDAISLIDHTNNTTRSIVGLTDTTSLLYAVNQLSLLDNIEILTGSNLDKIEDAKKYGTIFTPWCIYKAKVLDDNNITLPGSFAYLNALAISTRTNANWYAIAGVTRGLVPNLVQPCQKVTGAIASALQERTDISINPITNINPYGYCIWGNRTLNDNEINLTASSFLNIRALTNDIKKVVYTAARKLTFEINSDILWLNFKSEIEPTLDKMLSGNGLSGYKIIKQNSTEKGTIVALIKVYPIEAVEDFDITIELADNYISVE